ncbi:hypothetical protein [Dyella silvae]|uniref:hypothetical protein n=1 Tax=Dyella silvae TaxID=2994424 RepID=UPI002264746C|nr:hypothetical protein [Dyella silvae]
MGITTMWRKAQAATIIQELLDHQKKHGLLEFPTTSYANHLVAAVWAQTPDVMEGRSGPKPHKIAIAAFVSATGLSIEENTPGPDSESKRYALLFVLATILREVEENGHRYPFHHVDHQLLSVAMDCLMEHHEQMEQKNGDFYRQLGI